MAADPSSDIVIDPTRLPAGPRSLPDGRHGHRHPPRGRAPSGSRSVRSSRSRSTRRWSASASATSRRRWPDIEAAGPLRGQRAGRHAGRDLLGLRRQDRGQVRGRRLGPGPGTRLAPHRRVASPTSTARSRTRSRPATTRSCSVGCTPSTSPPTRRRSAPVLQGRVRPVRPLG